MTLLRILTNSERTTAACWRRWWFKYELGLTPGMSAAPLRFGSLWHACLATYYRSMRDAQVLSDNTIRNPLTAAEIVEAVIKPWLDSRVEFAMTSDVLNDGDREDSMHSDSDLANLCGLMLRHYIATWEASDLQDWEIVCVEQQGARLLMGTNGKPLTDMVSIKGQKKRRTWAYGGAIDLIIKNRNDGTLWFVEHKTTADRNLEEYKRKLYWDPQIRGYAWMLQNPVKSPDAISEPYKVLGVIYNVARKKVPSVPQPIKDGTRLSRQQTDSTREVYLAEILSHGFNPDHYADILEELKNNRFFDRETIPLSRPELEDFAHDAASHAERTIHEGKQRYHPRQTDVCTGLRAGSCPYASSVCLHDGPDARKNFRVMNIRHPELVGALSEESAGMEDQRQRSQDHAVQEAKPLKKEAPDGSVDPFEEAI